MRRGLVSCASLVLFLLPGVTAQAVGAEFGMVPGSLKVETLDPNGLPDQRAGWHPDRLKISFSLNPESGTAPRDMVIDISPGLAGTLVNVPTCSQEVLEQSACPDNTLIGNVVQALGGDSFNFPLHNIEPAPGRLAEFASKQLLKAPFVVALRPGDYGLRLVASELIQLPSSGTAVELWGVPLDHQPGVEGVPRRSFLTTPTSCAPISVTLRMRSWLPGAPWVEETGHGPPLEGCQSLPFDPQIGFALSDPAADVPSGVKMTLAFPQYDDPDDVVGSSLDAVDIQFPEGMAVSPAGAANLRPCSDPQFALGTDRTATCPSASRVGSVTIESPQATGPLNGKIFIGEERPGERFRLFIDASGGGAVVKLAGAIRTDPASGRLSVRLDELPPFPIDRMAFDIEGGSDSLLATPIACGEYRAASTLVPTSGGPSVHSTIPIAIHSRDGPKCSGPPRFDPELVAGSTNPVAGRPTSFSMTLRRQPGDQVPERFKVSLPAGLSPAIGSVDLCQGPEIASASCPASSRVGGAVAEAGTGSNPAAISGNAYLTGPYRRAPFGMALIFHAAIGPFDLGDLVIRGRLEIDPRTGQAALDTDALPAAIDGVPLRFQTIGVDLDRPGFLRNPTSCASRDLEATVWAVGGARAELASPFALRGCDSLGFRPRFRIGLDGAGSDLSRHGRPGMRVSARMRRGGTNLRGLRIALPSLLRFDIAGLNELCARRAALRGKCPPGSRVGSSRARSSLLRHPLVGGLFIVQPRDNGSPDLWASIDGEGVHLDLRGGTSSSHGRPTVVLAGLPDMPLSQLTMRLQGGEHGILSLRKGLCMDGQPRRLNTTIGAHGQDDAFRQIGVPVAASPRCEEAGQRSSAAARRRSSRDGAR